MFKRFSLQKQLVIIFSIIAIGILAILLPTIDRNLTNVIDNEMYSILNRSQDDFYAYNFSPSYSESNKQIYHFTYDVSLDVLYTSQDLSAKRQQLLIYIFKDDLYELTNNNKKQIQKKVKFNDQTAYYLIEKVESNKCLISLVFSDYSKSLINDLKVQVIDIFYFALLIIGIVLFIWVSSLIKPLKLIKNYIDNIKNDKPAILNIQRNDEIGILSSSLIEMKNEIDKQNKTKEEMIHNISHDLKTPIALIKTYTQSIKDDIYPYGDKASSCDVIIENTERLEKKVKSLLYLNRLDYLKDVDNKQVCNMKELIEHMFYQIKTINEDIDIEVELDDVSFNGNEEQWRVCIENIIENAYRYVNSKIRIVLKDNYLEIYNDGSKIEGDLERLFKPYEIGTKGQFGLGLSIVYKTVKMYGYHVEAINHDVGVSFVIKR